MADQGVVAGAGVDGDGVGAGRGRIAGSDIDDVVRHTAGDYGRDAVAGIAEDGEIVAEHRHAQRIEKGDGLGVGQRVDAHAGHRAQPLDGAGAGAGLDNLVNRLTCRTVVEQAQDDRAGVGAGSHFGAQCADHAGGEEEGRGVGARAAIDRIVAIAAFDRIGIGGADDGVVAGRGKDAET